MSLNCKRFRILIPPEDELPLMQNQKSPLKSGALGKKQKEASVTNPNTIIQQTSQMTTTNNSISDSLTTVLTLLSLVNLGVTSSLIQFT